VNEAEDRAALPNTIIAIALKTMINPTSNRFILFSPLISPDSIACYGDLCRRVNRITDEFTSEDTEKSRMNKTKDIFDYLFGFFSVSSVVNHPIRKLAPV